MFTSSFCSTNVTMRRIHPSLAIALLAVAMFLLVALPVRAAEVRRLSKRALLRSKRIRPDSDSSSTSPMLPQANKKVKTDKPAIKPSEMRAKEAQTHAKAAASSATHVVYRAVAGVPLGVASAASSLGGSIKSAVEGDFKKAGDRIAKVPYKLVGGAGMATVGAGGALLDTVHHGLHAAGCGIAAACNKLGGKDKPRKDRTEEYSKYRANERAKQVAVTKDVSKEIVDEMKSNTKYTNKALIKP